MILDLEAYRGQAGEIDCEEMGVSPSILAAHICDQVLKQLDPDEAEAAWVHVGRLLRTRARR